MLKPRLNIPSGFPPLLFLLTLLSLISSATVPMNFITTIAGTFETGSIVLTASTSTTSSGFSSQSTTLTYLNTYSATPSFGYGLSYASSQWPTQVTATETIFDVSYSASNVVTQTLQLNFTAGSVSIFSINYLLCASGFFLDIRTSYTDLTTTSLYSSNLASTRSFTINLPAKTKSNSSNTAAAYTTVGMSMMRAKNTFEFQLTTVGYSSSTVNVNLTVMPYNGMRFIRIMVFNYQTVVTTIASPYFIDIGFGANLGGTVPDSSGLGLTTTGTIFLGITDMAISDYYSVMSYNMSLSGTVYSLSSGGGITRTQTAYIWYRQAVCPTSYYNQSNVCAPCHYSCLSCTSGTATGCSSCDTGNFRSLLVSNFSCPCNTNYIDTNSAVCQEVLCYDYCISCSSNYYCAGCNSGTYRTLTNGSCVCQSYTVDFYDLDPITYKTCQPCYPTCLTCTDLMNRFACVTCNLPRDHRALNVNTNTCDCVEGYFQNPNTTTKTSLYNYKGVPCLACALSCATCTGNTTCATCNEALNRVYNGTSKLCSCNPGYYDNNMVQACFACPISCSTCSSSTVCLTCPPNTRLLTSNQCPCATGYYQSGVAACQACNYTCYTCTVSTSCATCNSAYFRSMSNGSCICGDGYYDTFVSQTCLPCDSSCRTCSGAGASACTSCNALYYRTLTTNKTCACMTGYYLDAGSSTCIACFYRCASCSDGSTCDSCNGTYNRLISGSSCLCNNKYYDGGSQNCASCAYYCLTCSSSSVCLTCHSSRNSSNLATCTCLTGYYDDGINSNCVACLTSCLTCNNLNNCTSCPTGRTITTVASCVCQTRTFEPYCNNCTYSCLSCLGSSTTCTDCNGTALRYLDSATSKCVCYQGYYDDGGNELCLACHYSCLTCSSGTACLSCPVNRIANGSYCSCLSSHFQNSLDSSNCLPCHYSCLSCSSYSVCSTCDAASYRTTTANSTLCVCSMGYYDNLVSVGCIQCYSICQTCSSYFTCTTCNATLNFYYSNGTCLCNTGYYFDAATKSCKGCDYSCNTCTMGTSCSSCKQNRTLTSTFCACTSGLFDNSVTLTCSSCTYPCITCTTSSTFCTGCDSTRKLAPANGTCNCFGSTYDTGLNCSSCLNTCQTCTNGSSCASCLSGSSRVLNINNLCLCQTDFHDQNGTSLNCIGCHYSCATCINSISCSTCPTGRSSVVGGYCACPTTYYYDNGNSASCIPCAYNCYTCSGISTNCTSCLGSTFRTLLNGTCSCNTGYYDDLHSATCLACHYSCQQCTDGTSCSACNATNKRTFLNTSLCSCMDWYFDVSNQPLCSTCSYTCLTCISSTDTCLTCPSLRTFVSASSSCPCKDGYYDAAVTVCVKCHYSCATCTNGTTCLTCPATRMPSVGQACLCNAGTYDAGFTTCSVCFSTCLTCSTYQVCTLCDSTVNFRQLTNGSCSCPSGYYDSSFTGNYTCQLCSYSCATCVSGIQCTSCNLNYQRVFNVSNSLCSCASGYYDNGKDAPCLPCPYDCVTCSNDVTCLTCTNVRYLASNNRCSCINSTYANGAICESCPVECLTCQNSSYCLSCAGNRTLLNNACVCPTGLYSVAGTSTCNGCQYSCSTCLAGTQCSTCNSTLFRYQTSTFCLCMAGYYDDGQNQGCKSCYYSCLLCAAANTCLTCNSGNNRIFNLNTSLCDCVSGYYEDPNSKACIQCQVSCVTCTNGSACTSCNPNYKRVLDNTTSQCNCLSIGYYDNVTTPICGACDYSCLSCSGNATYCTACLNTTMRTLATSSCVCATGYYDVVFQAICLPCSFRCVTCQGNGDNCTQCSAANYRSITPNCSCITGYYDNTSAICVGCDYVCLTCTMSHACTTCDLNVSHRAYNNVSKLCDCVEQFYNVGVNNICQSCTYSCLTCNAATTCLTCPTTRLITVSQCPCLPKYYDDLASLDCIACDYTCQSCRSGSTCFSCDSSLMRTFNTSTYRCSCMLGYYDVAVEACSKCDASCYSCINATACTSCPPNINKTLNASSGSNFCVCLYGYYENVTAGGLLGYSSVCSPCYYACQTCISEASYCTLCSPTSNRYLTASHECACNVGTFSVFGQQTCISCYSHCLSCTGTSSNNCLTCDNTTYYLNNSCYTTCPQFYNISQVTRTCVGCSSNCLSCPTSYTVCSQCNSPYFIFSYNVSNSVCVTSCPAYYYLINNTCYPCLSPCLSCTAAYTCTSCINLYYLTSGNCNPCHALCLTCSGSTALDCITCVPNYILKGSICQKLSCLPYQYVQSVTGCTNCSTTFPFSLTCLSTGPTSCVDGYILSNNSCLTCAVVPGYTLNSATGKCQDYCGDHIIITDLCDDGNNVNGDGCSSVCTIETGWTCPNNTCSLLKQPTVTVVSMSNAPLTHTITLHIAISVGLRLVAANFILNFSAITQYSYTVVALDSRYMSYQLKIVYYQTAANNELKIQIRSPISRLLIATNSSLSLSISLSVTVSVSVVTSPPAIYIPQESVDTYTTHLVRVMGALHVMLLLAAGVFLAMRLKVMLLVLDALASSTILYILTALGMFGVSLMSYESMRGLQPFIYNFGSALSTQNNLSYFSYSSNFFGSSIIQSAIIAFCFLLSACWSKKQGSQEQNHWHYYRVGFAFAFGYDLFLSCFSTFFWNGYTSYQSSYSWMFALLFLIYLCAEGIVYYARMKDSLSEGKKVVPGVSFITNEMEIRDRVKEVNIFEFQQEVSKEKRKGILSEWSDEQTEGLEAVEVTSKKAEEAVRYYDLTPSVQTQYSMSNRNHISAIHLPLLYILFPLILTVIVNIQTVTIRTALFLTLSLFHLLTVFLTKNSSLKSLRNIKLLILSLTYVILSALGLASSMNSQTIDLAKIDIVIVSLVAAAMVFNIAVLIAGVLKSEAFREYLINRKNEEILQRTKKQQEARMKIYTKTDFKETNKPIKPNHTQTILEEPESFEVRQNHQQQHQPEIQVSEQQVQEKEIRLSALKKQRRDEPTMLQANNSSINQHIDQEVSDFHNSDFRPPSDLLNDKQLERRDSPSPEPRSPSKKQGNRIRAINNSVISMVSRKGETPSLFFENSLERIDEIKGVKRNLDKSEEKEEVEGVKRSKPKRKKRPNVETDQLGREQQQPEMKMERAPRDSEEVLEGILEELDMPKGFKKPEDSSFRARIMSIDDISSIHEEREQFAMQQQRDSEYEGSVFNKILQDYQKYKFKKVDKKKLKDLKGKKLEKS